MLSFALIKGPFNLPRRDENCLVSFTSSLSLIAEIPFPVACIPSILESHIHILFGLGNILEGFTSPACVLS